LINRYAGGRDDTLSDGNYDCWPIPTGTENHFFLIDLEIQSGPSATRANVEAAISGTWFEGADIV